MGGRDVSLLGSSDRLSPTVRGEALNESVFRYGDFLNVVISFVSIAAAVFFLVVQPMNRLRGVKPDVEPEMRECPECLSSIPAAAHRCSFCTTSVVPLTAA